MKTLFLLLVSASLALGQNYLVRYYPDNKPYVGLTNYPAQAQPCEPKAAAEGWTNMTLEAYSAHIAALMPTYKAGESNGQFQAAATLNNKVQAVLDRIDALREWEDRTKTNSLNNAQQDKAINDICTALRRLRPVLKKLVEADPNLE